VGLFERTPGLMRIYARDGGTGRLDPLSETRPQKVTAQVVLTEDFTRRLRLQGLQS